MICFLQSHYFLNQGISVFASVGDISWPWIIQEILQFNRVKFEGFVFGNQAFPENLFQMQMETVWFRPSSDCSVVVLKALRSHLGHNMLQNVVTTTALFSIHGVVSIYHNLKIWPFFSFYPSVVLLGCHWHFRYGLNFCPEHYFINIREEIHGNIFKKQTFSLAFENSNDFINVTPDKFLHLNRNLICLSKFTSNVLPFLNLSILFSLLHSVFSLASWVLLSLPIFLSPFVHLFPC